MSKFLNTLIIGAASGAAAAYFFTTEKGKRSPKLWQKLHFLLSQSHLLRFSLH